MPSDGNVPAGRAHSGHRQLRLHRRSGRRQRGRVRRQREPGVRGTHIFGRWRAPFTQGESRAGRASRAVLRSRRSGCPPGLEVEWLGVSGYRLTYEGVSLFIDPYVSRVPLRACSAAPRLPDRGLLTATAGAPATVAGVLVGHTHFDHAIDAPAIARRHGPGVRLGLARPPDAPARARRPRGRGRAARPTSSGPFTVRFVPSRHSKLLFGRKVPMDGELTCDHLDGLRPAPTGAAQVWGIRIDVAGIALPPGQRRPRRRRALERRGRRVPGRASPAAASRRATGSGSFPGSTRGSSSRPTTTTSSRRSGGSRS